ncbi:MAG: hypothetical protein ACKVH8_04615 [Pirellulales bacterium]|jgi:Sec-independent protein secretion pathway component TatC
MWYPSVGALELLLVLCIAMSTLLVDRTRYRLWVISLTLLALCSVAITPADPVSTICVLIPLVLTFVGGIKIAPFVSKQDGGPTSAL